MSMKDYDSQILLSHAQSGNRAALAELVEGCRDRLFSFLLRLTNNRELAEDLFQETMLKAIRNLRQCQGEMKFLSWVFKIGHRCYIDHLRASGRNLEVAVEDVGVLETASSRDLRRMSIGPEDALLNKEFAEYLQKAEAELPEVEKEVYLLYRHSGMTFAEIAKTLECPLNTVLSRMHRAMGQLRSALVSWAELRETIKIQ